MELVFGHRASSDRLESAAIGRVFGGDDVFHICGLSLALAEAAGNMACFACVDHAYFSLFFAAGIHGQAALRGHGSYTHNTEPLDTIERTSCFHESDGGLHGIDRPRKLGARQLVSPGPFTA